MDKGFSKPIITTVILNQLIIVLAGHGYGLLLFIELPTFWGGSEVGLYLDAYDKSLPLVSILSLIGQIILLIGLFFCKKQPIIKWLGLFLLLVGYAILSKFLLNDVKSLYSFCSGLPFLLSSIWLMRQLVKSWV